MTYQKTLDWIHSHKANGRRPNLSRMEHLLNQLGNPQHQFPAVHIVGTNGKGSTTSYLQHIFTASGYKTGTFTSPYITRFNERIAIDNYPIPDEDLIDVVNQVQPHLAQLPQELGQITEFELVTVLMFVYFASQNVDIAFIEAGIGGLYDATNVFTALAVVLTSISPDHQETLGDSLTRIAQHKLGVLEEDVTLIFGKMTNSVRQTCYNEAYNYECPTYELGQDFTILDNGGAFDFTFHEFQLKDIHLKMLGKHQKANAALAIMTSLVLSPQFPQISIPSIIAGLEETSWPGRCELIKPNILLDGAHNPDSIAKLIDLLKEEFRHRPIKILFAGLKRKPLAEMLHQLSDFDVAVTAFDFYDAMPLADYPSDYARVTNYADWLAQAEQDVETLYVVTGSLYFISEVRQHILSKS